MRTRTPSTMLIAFLVAFLAAAMATVAFSGTKSLKSLNSNPAEAVLNQAQDIKISAPSQGNHGTSGLRMANLAAPTNLPTFGRPTISAIQGVGYQSAPALGGNGQVYIASGVVTELIWRSLDAGKTFKWVPAAAPLTGRPPICSSSAPGVSPDLELAVDPVGRLYLGGAALSPLTAARSDDAGAHFLVNCDASDFVKLIHPNYAIDGDPTAGGNLYDSTVDLSGAVCLSASPSPTPSPKLFLDGVPTNFLHLVERSPLPGESALGGLVFGPSNQFAGTGCNNGAGSRNAVSPVSHRVFVSHTNAFLDAILIGRCDPVAFGPPVQGVSDPSGLSCVELPLASMPGFDIAAFGPRVAIDRAGNLHAVWEAAPVDLNGNVTGDTLLYWSSSTDDGDHWTAPVQIPTPGLHNNVYTWIAAGDSGRVDIAWLGTADTANPDDPTCGTNSGTKSKYGGPDAVDTLKGPGTGEWSVYLTQTLNGNDPIPSFCPPVLASEHFVHRGGATTYIGGRCTGEDAIDIRVRIGADGEANVTYVDSNNQMHTSSTSFVNHGMFVRQNGGTGVFAGQPTVQGDPAPTNSVNDPGGDATFDANGQVSHSQPNLDILASSITQPDPLHYRIKMKVADLTSLAPDPTTGNSDTTLVWLTQWMVPSHEDSKGGKVFFAYMECTAGCPGGPTFWDGEAAASDPTGGYFTYPGAHQISGSYTPTTPGTITIDVPIGDVTETGAVSSTLYSVTASTMTLPSPAESPAPMNGVGGQLFNLIDVAPAYDFIPVQLVSVVSRMTHGSAGTFDLNLPLTGTPGIECRSSASLGAGNYTLVFTFTNNLTSVGSASVSGGTGSVAGNNIDSSNAHNYIVNLTGVMNAQYLNVTLTNVVDSAGNAGNVSSTMGVLIGDTTGDGFVNSADISQTKSQSGNAVTSANFREDVNTDGFINSADISLVKSKSGTALP